MPRFRLGIAGFGRLAQQYYVPALQRLHCVDQVLVADPLDSSRRAASRAFSTGLVFADPTALLAERPDGFVIATPPSSHLALWRLAAGAGIPVLVEKPFVLPGELAPATGTPEEQRLLMIDFNRRFWEPYRHIADLLRAGAVGPVARAELTLEVDVRPWCAVTSHRLDPREGGVLYDLGSQVVDLICWLLGGEPIAVRASEERHHPPIHTVEVELDFPGGVVARCRVGYGERTREALQIEGRTGLVWMADPNMAVHVRREPGARMWDRFHDLAVFGCRGLARSRSMSRRSIESALSAFVHAIRRSATLDPGFEVAARNTRLLEAASQAIELGSEVQLTPAAAGSAHG